MERKELTVLEQVVALGVNDIVEVRRVQMEVIKEIMKNNIHFGKIPGTPKPSLWQPGAQVLDTLHGYAPTFELLDKTEDWDKGFFHFRYSCRLIRKRDGVLVGEGVGSCNSREKKYRTAVYHGRDDEGKPVDPRDNVNTYEKMAQKRGHIAATLNATGLADIFTQDVEDMIGQFIPSVRVVDDDKGKTEHWCTIHNTEFFKRGKMKWYAHKIEGTDKWCNEEDVKKQKAAAPEADNRGEFEKASRDIFEEAADKASPSVPEPESVEDVKNIIDMDWLRESLKTLQDKGLKGWSEANLLSYMKITYKVEAGTVLEAVEQLDKGQTAHFVKRVQETLDMA